jgi:hypothetical protein
LTLNVIFSIIASMTTYQYNLTMPAVSPSASGAYPVAIGSNPYIPLDTMVFKLNDTIKIKVTHPLGHEIRLSVSDAVGADPNPTSPSTATYPINSGGPTSMPNDIGGWFPNNTVFGLTWSGTFAGGATAATDHLTRWYFHGRNAAFPNGTGSHSAEARLRKVVAPTLSASNSNSVVQGASITFTSSTITGLTASGNFGNRLYLSIYNYQQQLITAVGANGVAWDSSSVYFGKVGTSDYSTVMTAGANLPTGTYYAYLSHYNTADEVNGSTSVGNRFIDSENRLAVRSFTVTSSLGDITPNAFDFPDISGADTDTEYTSSPITVSGLGSGINAVIAMNQAKGTSWSKNSTSSFQTANGTVANGDAVRLRNTSPLTFPASQFNYCTIGDRSSNTVWMISTSQHPSGSNVDTEPDAFGTVANGFTTFSPVTRGLQIESAIVTMTGTTSSSSSTIAVTGTGSPAYHYRAVGGTFNAYTSNAGNIPSGNQFQLRSTASGDYGGTVQSTLTIGGITGSISSTAESAPTGGTGPGAGTSGYGLAVYNAAGVEVFGVNQRQANVVKNDSVQVPATGSTTITNVEGLTATNFDELVILTSNTADPTKWLTLVANRSAANNGSFELHNPYSTPQTVNYFVVRY